MKNAAQLQKIGFAKNDLFLIGFAPSNKASKFAYWNANNGNKFEAYSNGFMTVVFDSSKLWKQIYVFTNDCECMPFDTMKVAINVVNQIMAEIGEQSSDNSPSL